MKFTSQLADWKIRGVNLGAELSIEEYSEFLPSILDKNDYQRKRVPSSGKTYELLRADLLQGCVIPPIILATTEKYEEELSGPIETIMRDPKDEEAWTQVQSVVEKAIAEREVIILDGLQRSLTIKSILDQGQEEHAEGVYKKFLEHNIRVEVYAGLSKPGILYRMLTLNTGQTPMSFRHQLEILYHDYIDNDGLPDDIRVVREKDTARAVGDNRYKFSDVIDMFYAFSTGTPMPYTKQNLVSELKEMNFLEGFAVGNGSDDMRALLLLHNRLATRLATLAPDWRPLSADETEGVGGNEMAVERPFAPNLISAISRTQALTGFAAECRRLLEAGSIKNLEEIGTLVDGLEFSGNVDEALNGMIVIIDQIGSKAKRIGDAQRYYFAQVFRALFQPESDCQLDLSACWLRGQERYNMLYS